MAKLCELLQNPPLLFSIWSPAKKSTPAMRGVSGELLSAEQNLLSVIFAFFPFCSPPCWLLPPPPPHISGGSCDAPGPALVLLG